jgi:hypothetical protein
MFIVILYIYIYKGGVKEGGEFDEMGTDGPGPARKRLIPPTVLDENTFYLNAHQIDIGEISILLYNSYEIYSVPSFLIYSLLFQEIIYIYTFFLIIFRYWSKRIECFYSFTSDVNPP